MKTIIAALFGLILSAQALASKITEQMYIDFGITDAGRRSSYNLIYQNNSDQPVEFISARITGTSFSFKTKCPQIIPVKESCVTTITFRPNFDGFYDGRLFVETSEKNYNIQLRGYARPNQSFPPAPNLPPLPPRP